VHVIADAAVSVLAIVGLVLVRTFGWLWMDPLAGIIGALVIANWSYGLMRDTGAILLDMNPDRRMANGVRRAIASWTRRWRRNLREGLRPRCASSRCCYCLLTHRH
jgi:Co/Zn/Cd efflux system component